MGKRSPGFERMDRDHYASPPEAMAPLLPHIPRGATFAEPCAGEGRMIDYFESAGHTCVFACDIHPLAPDITRLAATDLKFIAADLFITNPPWKWEMLEPIAMHLSSMRPTWLLLPADMIHNVRSATLMERCAVIVPIGRIKWIPLSRHSGVDNAIWAQFLPGHRSGPNFRPRSRTK